METDEKYKHPSFGQIKFSRVQGRQDFYGSEFPAHHYITMEVVESEMHRSLSREWYFGGGRPLIAVRMTANQFSEMITSMNHGSGIPCTIEMVDRKKVEEYPGVESNKEFTSRKFQERMSLFAQKIRENQEKAKELVKKKTLSKEDVRNLSFCLEWLTQEIESNIPYFAECFQEQMDTIVLDAKTEVENAIQHKIATLGLTELHNQQKLLTEK